MKQNINRRDFLKILGLGATTVGLASTGCAGNSTQSRGGSDKGDVPKGQISSKKIEGIDENLSLIGYGCMRWPQIDNPQKGENPVDQEAVNELVDYAIDHGINYFDTAPVYSQGWNEEVTGNALSRYPRESYYLATKLSNNKLSYDQSIAMYNNSFKKLQTDYIDYYILHNVGSSFKSFSERFIENGVLDFLIGERKAGRIRRLGWSFHGSAEVFDQILALHDEVHWDFVQIQLNYSDWRNARKTFTTQTNAEYLYNELAERNIPVAVMEPLLGGRLVNLPEHVFEHLKERDPESSTAAWALRFAASRPMVYTVLSGMIQLDHVKDNIRTFSPLVPLNDNEEDFLQDVAKLLVSYPTIDCNDCKYCMPCPYGIDIPAILLHYNKCVNEGNISNSKTDDNFRKARRAYLVSYDRAVPKLRQAKKCISCGECISHCPQKINIPKELKRIDDYIEQLKQETL